MRCRFTALSACHRPGTLLVAIVVVGDWAACPNLQLQNRSCIMTPIQFYTFCLSNELTLCVYVCGACTQGHKVQDRTAVKQSGCTAQKFFGWEKEGAVTFDAGYRGFLSWTLKGQTEASARARKQGHGPQLSTATEREGGIQGRGCLRMIRGKLNLKSIWKKEDVA